MVPAERVVERRCGTAQRELLVRRIGVHHDRSGGGHESQSHRDTEAGERRAILLKAVPEGAEFHWYRIRGSIARYRRSTTKLIAVITTAASRTTPRMIG